jgi:transcriptional regulator GlxA family with amidase domain
MYRAVAILYPDALATSFTLPMEILQAAGQMVRARDKHREVVSFQLAAPTLAPVSLTSGLRLTPDTTFATMEVPDLLILPAIWRNPRHTIARAAPWLPELQRLAARDCKICSVGTASCLLAEAGLLTGKPATTHWNYFETFSRAYPEVDLKTRHLITQSDNIYCAGSVNSVADLIVHLLEEAFGSRIARAIENQFSPEIRRSFKSAAYQNRPGGSHHDELVLEAQQWLEERLASSVSLEALAHHQGISARTLNRRFQRAIGMTPQGYLHGLRMNAAQDLLRHSNLAVTEIAWQVGLQDPSYFSQLFKRHANMTPLQYRQAVRGKLFTPELAPYRG